MNRPLSTPKPQRAAQQGPPRLLITLGMACVAVFIAAEPLLLDGITSGMQTLQGTLVFGFWVLLMFGGLSRH